MSGPPGSRWIQRQDNNRNRRYWQNSVTQEKTYDRPAILEIPAYPSATPAYPSATPAYPSAAQVGGGISYAPAPAPGTHYAGGFAAQTAVPNNPYVNTPAFSTRPVYPPCDTSRSAASAPPASNPALAAAEHALIVAQSGVHDSTMLVDMLGKELTAHETVVESRKRQLAAAIADHEKIEAKLAASIAALNSAEAAVAAAFTAIDNVENAEEQQKSKERAEIEAAIAQVAKLEAQEKEEREAREAAEAIARVALAERSEAAAAEKAVADARELSLQAEMQQAMEQALEAEMQAAMAASIAAVPIAVHVPAAAPVVAQPAPAPSGPGPVTPPGSRWIRRTHESNNRKYWQNNVTGEKTYVNPL